MHAPETNIDSSSTCWPASAEFERAGDSAGRIARIQAAVGPVCPIPGVTRSLAVRPVSFRLRSPTTGICRHFSRLVATDRASCAASAWGQLGHGVLPCCIVRERPAAAARDWILSVRNCGDGADHSGRNVLIADGSTSIRCGWGGAPWRGRAGPSRHQARLAALRQEPGRPAARGRLGRRSGVVRHLRPLREDGTALRQYFEQTFRRCRPAVARPPLRARYAAVTAPDCAGSRSIVAGRGAAGWIAFRPWAGGGRRGLRQPSRCGNGCGPRQSAAAGAPLQQPLIAGRWPRRSLSPWLGVPATLLRRCVGGG
jgi:hypothetical protein